MLITHSYPRCQFGVAIGAVPASCRIHQGEYGFLSQVHIIRRMDEALKY